MLRKVDGMRRVERIPESVFGLENSSNSSIDTNRFYSILLDAKVATVSENMCDITEKLLHAEKENAKNALEQLWNLKKNLLSQNTGTLDMVISFYQDKIDILRNKEEYIKKISKDSRSLLEEKRKRDEEVASVKQQIDDCSSEISELTQKLDKLRTKEQELIFIEEQLKKDLNTNENEIVNGLYEIILSQQEREDELRKLRQQNTSSVDTSVNTREETSRINITQNELVVSANEQPIDNASLQNSKIDETEESMEQFQVGSTDNYVNVETLIDVPAFPKSVVKTTNGRVIGEYYYDGKVYKNERDYIFNSKFFSERLSGDVKFLKQKFDQTIYSEVMQMIQQAYKRVIENSKFHFEISTNEILNEKTLKLLWQNAKLRDIDEVDRFCNRLKAKIEALGNNYKSMLQEQMKRCVL
jgi:hypothetical protein